MGKTQMTNRAQEVGGEIPEQLCSLLGEESGPTVWELMERYGRTPKPPRTKKNKNRVGKEGPPLFLLLYENREEVLDLLLRFLEVYEEDPNPLLPRPSSRWLGLWEAS